MVSNFGMRSQFLWAAFFASLSPALAQTPADQRDVSWKEVIPNILEDQREIWTFPAPLAQDHNIIPAAAFVAGAAATMAWADPPGARYFRNSHAFNTYNSVFATTNTLLVTALTPVPFYLAGMWKKDVKAKKTALFSAEALADSEVVLTVLKQVTNRERPISIPPNGRFSDSFWDGGRRSFTTSSSFPSGHAIAAFSVATVVARRYRDHRWAPFVAYGAAAAIGFSRMTLSAHFASDVLVGGVLGYSIGRFTVLRQ
jgi:membrane-associated phospholipid phosphatase